MTLKSGLEVGRVMKMHIRKYSNYLRNCNGYRNYLNKCCFEIQYLKCLG